MSSLFHQFPHQKKVLNYRDNRAIVFIDAQFSGCSTIVQQIIPEARVIVINSQANGIKEITHILNHSFCLEVYLICYGSPGCLRLGNSELSINTLIQYKPELQSWFANSSVIDFDAPRLYLHGCNAASGDVGDEFMTKLKRMTGATIAASVSLNNCNVIN